ncbi:MAG: hypothetical protein HY831_03060 [Candidatus Aenigmarchaeota archaeon]|nr:hypothetical protein [Candidatus Aenigmarchaeota archaeon]
MNEINLLDLHDPNIDKSPSSWIEFNGILLDNFLESLIGKICNSNKISRNKLAFIISNNINCHQDNICKRFYKIKGYNWYPIPLIISLIKMSSDSKETIKKNEDMVNSYIEYIRCGKNYNILPAVKTLKTEISSLCGAIVADGHLSRDFNGKERITIVDFYENAIKKCSKWLEASFGIKGRVYKSISVNAWYLFIDSKVITRFFNTYFSIPYGKKSYIVKEPNIIKNSNFRLDFAKGVLLMDGSVELDYIVSFGTVSKELAEDIKEILDDNNYSAKFSFKKSNNCYMVKTNRITLGEAKKWIEFFGKDTEKGYKLYLLSNIFTLKINSIQEAMTALNILCKKTNSTKIELKDIINIIINEKEFTKKTLSNKLNVGKTTLYKYLWLLEKSNIIKSRKTKGGPGLDNFYYYNDDIDDWKVPINVST